METLQSVYLDVPGYANYVVACQDHSDFRAEPSRRGCPTGVMETTITVVPEPRKIREPKQGPSWAGGLAAI